jgi:hypothetical protein
LEYHLNFSYLLGIVEHPDMLKFGEARNVATRILGVNLPRYTHYEIWSTECSSRRHAIAYEAMFRLALRDSLIPPTPACPRREYAAPGPDVVARIRDEPGFVAKLLGSDGPDGPLNIESALVAGKLSCPKILVYEPFSWEGATARRVFEEDCLEYGIPEPPSSMVYDDPAMPRGRGGQTWRGMAYTVNWVLIPGPSGGISDSLLRQLMAVSPRTSWDKKLRARKNGCLNFQSSPLWREYGSLVNWSAALSLSLADLKLR